MMKDDSTGWAVACFIVALCALIVSIFAYDMRPKQAEQKQDCIKAGDIRYHNGRPCIVERVTVDEETHFLIVDETLLEQL